MIEAHRFTERACGVPFASANHPAFFGIVVPRQLAARKSGFASRRFNGVRYLVPQAKRRGLRSAARRTQRAVRIPGDGIGIRIEAIVTAMIHGKMERSRAVLQPFEEPVFLTVAAEVGARQLVVRASALRNRYHAVQSRH